ncbi:MAG: hypothetical protein AAAC47_28750 [Pararhizobium sp.]
MEALFALGRDLLDVKLTVDSMADPSANAQGVHWLEMDPFLL